MQIQNPIALVVIIVIVIAVVGYAIYSAIKRREEVFEGEVVDKDVIETEAVNHNYGPPGTPRPSGIVIGNAGSGIKHTYKIKVKTDQGKVIGYVISEGMYETVKIGDRVSKAKGSAEITIVAQAAGATVPPPPAPPPSTPPPPLSPNPPSTPPPSPPASIS